jgi:hypothetical protein
MATRRRLWCVALLVAQLLADPLSAQGRGLVVGDSAIWLRSRALVPSAHFPLLTGIDALPVVGGSPLRAATQVAFRDVELLYGGRLGAADAVRPAMVRGKAVLFDPPLSERGGVHWEPWSWTAVLERYHGAAVILVASLDWVPEHWRARLLLPDPSTAIPTDAPRVVLVSRAAASMLRDASTLVGQRGQWDVAVDYRPAARTR